MGFSLYTHHPYCLQKCPYCDFTTYAVREFPETRYVDALRSEILAAANDPAWRGRKVSTVFFGGGTPSLFAPSSIAGLLEEIDGAFSLASDCEITLEANPGSLEGGGRDKLAAFRAAGVNRLSIGGQSFHPAHLKTLGRVHGAEDTAAALRAARDAGFENLSCDLMFAIPGQTIGEWESDLRRLAAFDPDHVSAYNLTYENGTPMTGLLNAGRIRALDEESERAMFLAAIDTLGRADFTHYEISNFAKPGREARHNLAYWTWRDYLGIGAGAHGFYRRGGVSDAWGVRYANRRLPEAYMSAAAGDRVDKRELVGRESAVSEFVMLGLRLTAGISRPGFEATFGGDVAQILPELSGLVGAGLLDCDEESVRLSAEGMLLADTVITRLAATVR